MEFKREIIINAPAEKVWEVLGTQFGRVCDWASGVNKSSASAHSAANTDYTNRACDTTSGKIKEVVNVFDPQRHELEYEVIEGFPFFVKTGKNNWKLTAVGSKTKVNMNLQIVTQGFVGKIMRPMMKMQMNKIADNAVDDLKVYVETGKPSARKAKELAKMTRKAA